MRVRFSPEWILRTGLGAVYAYSGYSHIAEPRAWAAYAPDWFANAVSAIIPLQTVVQFQGGLELMFAVVFLGWFFWRKTVRVFAGLATLEILSVLILAGINLVTFRDVGLFAAVLALWLSLKEKFVK